MRLISLLCLGLFSSTLSAQQASSSAANFTPPEDEYRIIRMTQSLEEEQEDLREKLAVTEDIIYKLELYSDALVDLKGKQSSPTDFFTTLEEFKYFRVMILETSLDMQLERCVAKIDRAERGLRNHDPYYSGVYTSDVTEADVEKAMLPIDELLTVVNASKDEVAQIKSRQMAKIDENEVKLQKLHNARAETDDLHRIAIKIGLPAFCATILFLFLIPYYLERRSNSPQAAGNKQYLLDVATVLLLTMSILILGLAKVISEEVLGTLLGGISGYVLNRSSKQSEKSSSEKSS